MPHPPTPHPVPPLRPLLCQGLELNVGGACISAALVEATGTPRARLRRLYDTMGDIGDVAQVGVWWGGGAMHERSSYGCGVWGGGGVQGQVLAAACSDKGALAHVIVCCGSKL